MSQAARVIKLTEYGPERLKQAIAQGLVSGDIRSDVDRALRAAEMTERDNNLLRARNAELEAVNRYNTQIHVQAYQARLREKQLRYDYKYIAAIIVIATVMATVTVASVIVWGVGL